MFFFISFSIFSSVISGGTTESVRCEGETFSLECPNKFINIIDVKYGRNHESGCASDILLFPGQQCSANIASYIVPLLCQGKSTCEFPISSDVFGDPCYGVAKELIVHHKCVDVPSAPMFIGNYELGVYQDQTLNMDCGNRYLNIEEAHYGRDSCFSETAYGVILKECQGKNSCKDLKVSEQLFGNPCPAEIKKVSHFWSESRKEKDRKKEHLLWASAAQIS